MKKSPNFSLQSFTNLQTTVSLFQLNGSVESLKSLFEVKSRNPHPACKICEGECTCGEKYIGEIVRNVEIRWQEHNSLKGDSEPAKHLTADSDHTLLGLSCCQPPILIMRGKTWKHQKLP